MITNEIISDNVTPDDVTDLVIPPLATRSMPVLSLLYAITTSHHSRTTTVLWPSRSWRRCVYTVYILYMYMYIIHGTRCCE